MTYTEACQTAYKQSLKNPDCGIHVNARLRGGGGQMVEPSIDPNGYKVSDWFDGATVVTYVNGKIED